MEDHFRKSEYSSGHKIGGILRQMHQLDAQNLEKMEHQLARFQFTKAVMEDNLRLTATSTTAQSSLPAFGWGLLCGLGLGGLLLWIVGPWERLTLPTWNRSSIAHPSKPSPTNDQRLTDRELEVLQLMADAKSNPEIADALFISKNTAKTHVANILGKLEAVNRQQAVNRAQEMNLIIKRRNGKTVPTSSLGMGIGILLALSLLSPNALAQGQLKNETDCSFLVKVNILEAGECRLNGDGPLVKLLPHQVIDLPPIPTGSHIPAYGIEEVNTIINEARIAGDPSCNFRSIIGSYGSCAVTLKYHQGALLITN
ncbi:response regulator transcription factor [bacterium SCSIO 12741]|nr:response regulator transcription factor [bacterium SCSIO 12741]